MFNSNETAGVSVFVDYNYRKA